MRARLQYLFLLALTAGLSACSLIDEDLRHCGTDYNMNYELRLVTNMTTELQTQLSMAADVQVASALEDYLKNVFTDHAHDVNLSFYDVFGDSLRLHHESHIMDANQSSYSLYIPVRKYMHVAVANNSEVPQLQLVNDDKCHTALLQQVVKDTVETFKRAVFTARLPMDIKEGEDQQFDVKLYTTSCAHALVLDTLGSHIKDIKVYTAGFATDFDLADSTYHYLYTPIFRTDKVDLSDASSSKLCFASVTFPSRTAADTKVIIETTDPFVTEDAAQTLWQYRVYTTLQDNSVTETLLSLRQSLQAGQLKVLTANVYENGTISPSDPTVGVSVTMDWDPGLEVDVVF